MSVWALEREYGVMYRTVRKAVNLAWPEPRKKLPPRVTALDPYTFVIDQMLRADPDVPRKQRHTVTFFEGHVHALHTLARGGPPRPALHRRTWLQGTRPSRSRTPLPGPDRTRGEEQRRHCLQRVLGRLDRVLHRPPRLCAALVDRLTFDGTLIEIGTDSYRLAGTRARAEHIEAS